MNESGNKSWDIRPSGQPAPLDDEATPTVVAGDGERAVGATELVGSSAGSEPTSHMPVQPEAGYVPDSPSPFPPAPGGGDGAAPFEPYSSGGDSDGGSTTLMLISLAGIVAAILLFWFTRCNNDELDRLSIDAVVTDVNDALLVDGAAQGGH